MRQVRSLHANKASIVNAAAEITLPKETVESKCIYLLSEGGFTMVLLLTLTVPVVLIVSGSGAG